MATKYSNFKKIFTDGSKDVNSTSAAFYEPNGCTKKIKFQEEQSIFVAECYGLLCAIVHHQEHHTSEKKLCVITDSQSVVIALENAKNNYKTHHLIGKLRNEVDKMIEKGIEITVIWAPSHSQIMGNERADVLAKEAHNTPDEHVDIPKNHKDAASDYKNIVLKNWQKEWRESDKGRFCHSIIPKVSKIHWFKDTDFSRTEIVFWNRIITNHTRCRQSLFRFKIVDHPMCECKKNFQTVDHVLFECAITSSNDVKQKLRDLGYHPPWFIRDIVALEIHKIEKNAMRLISEKMAEELLKKGII